MWRRPQKSLDQLGGKYSITKSSHRQDFCRIYEKVFRDIRDQRVKLLELGIWEGCKSLPMWRSFFLPGSVIVGIDCMQDRVIEARERGYLAYCGNQEDEGFLRRVIAEAGPFDVIIDDCGHKWSDTIKSFEVLFCNGLRPRGFYVIEDLHCAYRHWERGKGALCSTMSYLKMLVDNLNCHGEIEFKRDKLTKAKEDHFSARLIKAISFYCNLCIIEKADHEWYEYSLW